MTANEGMDHRVPIKGVIDTYGPERLYEIFTARCGGDKQRFYADLRSPPARNHSPR